MLRIRASIRNQYRYESYLIIKSLTCTYTLKWNKYDDKIHLEFAL